jgi:hypothetical protein
MLVSDILALAWEFATALTRFSWESVEMYAVCTTVLEVTSNYFRSDRFLQSSPVYRERKAEYTSEISRPRRDNDHIEACSPICTTDALQQRNMESSIVPSSNISFSGSVVLKQRATPCSLQACQ